MPEIDKEEIPKNPELEFGFYSITYELSKIFTSTCTKPAGKMLTTEYQLGTKLYSTTYEVEFRSCDRVLSL